MYKLFEKNSIIAYLICLGLYVLYGVRLFTTQNFYVDKSEFVILDSIFQINEKNVFLYKFLSFTLFGIVLVLMYNLAVRRDLTLKNELIAVAVVLIFGVHALLFSSSLSSFILIFFFTSILTSLVNTPKKSQTVDSIYYIGVLYGMTTLLSPNTIVLLPLLLICINQFGKNGMRDIGGLLLGLCTPIYILITYLYLTDNFHLISRWIGQFHAYKFQFPTAIQYLPIAISIISGVLAMPYIANFNINTRKLYTVIFGALVLLSISAVFLKFNHLKYILALMFVGSLYFSIYLSHIRNKRLRELLLIVGIVSAIINTFVSYN